MKAWSRPAVVICLTLLSHVAWAGQPVFRSLWEIDSVVPAYLADDHIDGVVQIADEIPPRPADNPLPPPLSAAPPPDPEPARWGNFVSPSFTAVVPQPKEYSLIGPPTGFGQRIDDQEYRAVITDPSQLLAYDAQFGQNVDIYRPDGMAPVGMFGDHTLPTGTAFVSYRYLQNTFEQNYVGSHRTGTPTSYPFAPTRMMQDSQVALVEYGVTTDITMLAYLPFQHNEINSDTATGTYKTTFTNPGDIRIMGLIVLNRGERSQGHLNIGLSLPVGLLEQQTSFGVVSGPSATAPNLPYQIRTSSGTYDLLLGYTYRKQTDNWTWGAQANAVIPTGKNTLDYEVGNQFQTTAWLSRRWSERWSTSARLDGHWNGNIRGADPRLDTTLSPVNQANAQARAYLNGLLGVNYLLTRPEHRIREQRLFLESGVPLYQWVEGQQLGLSWTLNAGWGMAF